MNDKALYQLERAIDALEQMVKYLRKDQQLSTLTTDHYTYYTESRTDYNSTGGVNITL